MTDPESKSRWLDLLTFLVVATVIGYFGYAGFRIYQKLYQPDPPLKQLIQFVKIQDSLEEPTALPKLRCILGQRKADYQLSIAAPNRRTHTIQIRETSDRSDILFIEGLADPQSTHYYATTTEGKLYAAISCTNGELRGWPEDAEQRFEKEKEFWLTWWHEKLKLKGS